MPIYQDSHRKLQDRFDTRRLADRLDESLVHSPILPDEKEFIENRDMFFLASVDARGHANCSYRGGHPGFVRVLDEHTLVFPNYNGNGMFLSMGNVLETQQIGMLFIDFEQGRRMRLNGEARISLDDPLRKDFPEAEFLVRVTPREIFANCPRYIHKMQLVERSRFAPTGTCSVPVPGWKKGDWVKDVLPVDDPAHDDTREVL
ncbi:MAG: pyridoxamine 5'-phosphate oxidase family protein [Gammaproteobacteria bacterium]|nr:pyridoxamine 5'-phosphate oxidase family protein [Gammaproteobacteria bacterium]